MRVLILLVALTIVASVNAYELHKLIKPQFASGDIISGVDAEPGEAPYIVSLKTSSHFCAGSIIDEHWVLTAGHCIIYEEFSVVAGLYNRNDESQAQIRTVYKDRHTIIHSLYKGGVGPNDIGLIYIEKALDFIELSRVSGKPLVNKVLLPSRQFSQLREGTLFGWGRDNTNNLANTLQKLDTEILDYPECKDILPLNAPIDPVNICSYNNGTIASTCNGDSGGPLVEKNGNYVEQIGIVSWGYTPCTSTRYPSIYTSTGAFIAWIVENQKNYVPPKA